MKKGGEPGIITITVKSLDHVGVRIRGIKNRHGMICLLRKIADQLETPLAVDVDEKSFDEIYNGHMAADGAQ